MSDEKTKPDKEKEEPTSPKVLQGIKAEIASFKFFLWFVGWLFTLGFVGLKGWSILWSLVIWPYYLGHALK